jgi:hypothetical protein
MRRKQVAFVSGLLLSPTDLKIIENQDTTNGGSTNRTSPSAGAACVGGG